jgi:hypothetical protein
VQSSKVSDALEASNIMAEESVALIKTVRGPHTLHLYIALVQTATRLVVLYYLLRNIRYDSPAYF